MISIELFFVYLEHDDPSISTPILTDNSSISTSGVLHLKELRSVIESKRRNFSRSASSSDSEDNGSTQEIHRRNTRSPSSLHESDYLMSNRGRSFSNVEYEFPSNNLFSTNNESTKRRSTSSRAHSLVSTNRSILSNINDENSTNHSGTIHPTLINDRIRSLSIEHRLTNQSQMSIASRTSIRYSTPRESTVFTKTDAPSVIRLLQQTPHHDPIDVIKTLIEHQRQEHIRTVIIVEEETAPAIPLLSESKFPKTSKSNVIAPSSDEINLTNGHLFSSLKYSLIQQRKSSHKHRRCCILS